MEKIRKGDIVGRKSYGKDIIFVVDRVLKSSNSNKIAILKGLNIRIQADSDLADLELIDKQTLEESEKKSYKRFEEKVGRRINEKYLLKRSKKITYTGKILHLDGDCNIVYMSIYFIKL